MLTKPTIAPDVEPGVKQLGTAWQGKRKIEVAATL